MSIESVGVEASTTEQLAIVESHLDLTAAEMLENKWDEGKFLCVGLDVVEDENGTLYEKAVQIVNATRDIAAAYKPNDAFYASLGSDGVRQLEELVGYIKHLAPEILVIWDAKRADIANTNGAYASAMNKVGSDAITLQPYLGGLTLEPLLDDPKKLGIVLAHTSNPGADELQELRLSSGKMLWEHVVSNVAHDKRWQHGSSLGIVMGATFPEHIARARYIAGDDVMMLVPGIGKQGGDLEKSVRGAMNSRGTGFLINVSSGISSATDENGDVTEVSIREAAIKYDAQIRSAHQDAKNNPGLSYYETEIAEFDTRLVTAMVDSHVMQFGSFVLKNGSESPIYVDNRNFITDPSARSNVAQIFVDLTLRAERRSGIDADFIAGNPQSGITWAALVADRLNRPLIQPRAGGIKDHGTGKLVEGVYGEGQTVTLIEDLVTSATSVFETQDDKLTPSGLVLANVVSLVCRDQMGLKAILERELTYEHAITLERIMKALGQTGKVEALESGLRGRVEAYINR
jgi:orotidine 5'-phosphate decarboxylase subfamily 2